MAIRVIQKGDVICDHCKRVLAEIRTSEQVYAVLLEEARFTEVICYDCHNPRIKNKQL